MNLLGLVFGLLMIFACTFSLSLRKQSIAVPIEETYQAHLKVTRKILKSYESECFDKLSQKKKVVSESSPVVPREHNPNPREPVINHLNENCARLNLWPLIQEGRDRYPALYETAAQILRASYANLFDQSRLEYTLLDALLAVAKRTSEPNTTRLALEKFSLKGAGNAKQLYPLHSIYYRMLKGTKHQGQQTSYPSLLEIFVLEKKDSPICLLHASFEMFAALFGSKAGASLYREVHQSNVPLLKERIREVCSQAGASSLNEAMLDLLDFRTVHHPLSEERILVEEASGVCLKKRVFLPG